MKIAGARVGGPGPVGKRPREHLLDDCAQPDTCLLVHRIMSHRAERSSWQYPGEWVLMDNREGVQYHGSDVGALIAAARAERGVEAAARLVLYKVPHPDVAYFYGVQLASLALR